MPFSLGLLGACTGVVIALVAVTAPRWRARNRGVLFARFAGLSALAAASSSFMYLLHGIGGGPFALWAADTSMVLAPSFLALALSMRGPVRMPTVALAVAIVSAIVAVGAAVSAPPTSLAVKACALAVVCLAVGGLGLVSRDRQTTAMRTIVVVNIAYAVFSILRVVVGSAAGWQSEAFLSGFSFAPTTVAGGLAVVVVGVALVALIIRSTPPPPTRVDRDVTIDLVVGHPPLETPGGRHVDELVEDLRRAARAVGAATDIDGGTRLVVPPDTTETVEDVRRTLRAGHGWTKDQAAVVTAREHDSDVRS